MFRHKKNPWTAGIFVYYHWPQVGVVPRMIDPSSPCHFGVISTIRVYPTISNVPKICNQHLGLLTFDECSIEREMSIIREI